MLLSMPLYWRLQRSRTNGRSAIPPRPGSPMCRQIGYAVAAEVMIWDAA